MEAPGTCSGHLQLLWLVSRESLSCFPACNRFVHWHNFEAKKLWQSCCEKVFPCVDASWSYREVSGGVGSKPVPARLRHSPHIGDFMLDEQGKLLRDEDGLFMRVP